MSCKINAFLSLNYKLIDLGRFVCDWMVKNTCSGVLSSFKKIMIFLKVLWRAEKESKEHTIAWVHLNLSAAIFHEPGCASCG